MPAKPEGDKLIIRPDLPRACEHVRLTWWLVGLLTSLALWAGIGLVVWVIGGAARGG